MQETWVQSLDWEDPLQKGKATHSSILAWRIPWTEEPGGLQPMGSQRIGHNWVTWKKSSPVKPLKPSMPGPLFVGSSLIINLFTCYRYIQIIGIFQIFYFLLVLVVFNLTKNFPNSAAAAVAKSLQPCPTLCDPIDCSPPGSPVPGILQARTLEWVAISFSNAWKWKVKVKSLSCVWLFATPWTTAYQAPPSMGFSRQEYWSGSPLPSHPIHLVYLIYRDTIVHSTSLQIHFLFL